MMKTALHSVFLLVLVLLAPRMAAAEDLAPYQTLEIRHVCTSQPIRATPAGAETRIMEVGEGVVLQGITYGPDQTAWFALDYATGRGLERATGYLPVSEVTHFCADPARGDVASDSSLQTYIAPPNSCHLVVGQANTVAGLNELAGSMPGFAASMSGYRLHSGGYGLTAGLLSTETATRIVARSDHLPASSFCASGAEFAEALIYDGSSFSQVDDSALDSDVARLAGAQAMFTEARKARDPQGLKQACDLGLGAACTGFAHLIFGEMEGQNRGPAVLTRYAMLGCMAGDLDGCQMAVNRLDNTLELTRTNALVDAADFSGRVTTELSKLLCDAQDRFGCILQARGTAVDRSPSMVEAASNFAANLIACRQGIAWICEELGSGFDLVVEARGDSVSADERFAIAGINTGLCTMGPREPNQRSCTPAYYGYRDFLRYSDAASLDAARVAKAVSVLTDGCAAGDPSACATLAAMPDYWSVPDRQLATVRANALCTPQSEKETICESLGSILDPTLPETRLLLRPRYDSLSQSCLTPGNGAYQDCIWALHTYAALEAPDGLATAEAMLNKACSPANSNGCEALSRLYGKSGHEFRGIKISGRNDLEAYLATLRMGCKSGSQDAGSTCTELADAMATDGDGGSALDVLAQACTVIMDGQEGQEGQNVSECYEATKMALTQNVRLDEALVWANFVCDTDDISIAPYACKLAGNILARGLGVTPDPAGALLAYQRGCFHPQVRTTDGEACLNYGNLLIEAVSRGEAPSQPLSFAYGEDGEKPEPSRVLTEASRAFDMGCMDTIEMACSANVQLLDKWSTGSLPYDAYTCQVKSASGEVASEKPCRGFLFYQTSDDLKQSRQQIALNVYVWPDGDRSVTYVKDGVWRLNELRTDQPVQEGITKCWHNPVSTRTFCVTPAG